jgi:hypothetical protein
VKRKGTCLEIYVRDMLYLISIPEFDKIHELISRVKSLFFYQGSLL